MNWQESAAFEGDGETKRVDVLSDRAFDSMNRTESALERGEQMPDIDFTQMTTDELLQIIPATETNEWEFKAATVFDKSNFGAFKKQKLGKIVSSFANTGGGYLLLGKRDDENVFDPVPLCEGRARMEDHLSIVMSQSVAPHYRDFEIFRIPITDTSDSVLVVKFSDSPLAPHQSIADMNYFYRIPGHSMPAPHFHLELLRSRFTKSVVEIVDVECQQLTATPRESTVVLSFALRVTVENKSLQSATAWGVHIRNAREDYRWSVTNARSPLSEGTCIRGEHHVLLPSERAVVTIHVYGEDRLHSTLPSINACDLADKFSVVLRPVSQNFVGREHPYRLDSSDVHGLRRRIEDGLP